MFGLEISQWAALKRQMGGRNGQEGWPAPLSRTSWSTVLLHVPFCYQSKFDSNCDPKIQKSIGLLAFRLLDTPHSRTNTGQSPSVRIKRLSNSPNFKKNKQNKQILQTHNPSERKPAQLSLGMNKKY